MGQPIMGTQKNRREAVFRAVDKLRSIEWPSFRDELPCRKMVGRYEYEVWSSVFRGLGACGCGHSEWYAQLCAAEQASPQMSRQLAYGSCHESV